MTVDLKPSIVRVVGPDGATVGTGFVVTDDGLVATCAHVVEACGVGPGERVRLAFRAEDAPVEAEVLADGWHTDQDVAFLRLATQLPDGVAPATLGPSAGVSGHTFRAFGYPRVGDFRGVWAEGQILGQVTDERGAIMLQLRAQEIAPGMSGAPVLDASANRVVGMVTMTYQPDATLKFRDAAFAIPAETLRDLRPEEIELRPAQPVQETPRGLLMSVPFQAPSLPAHFVPRPEASDVLKACLLTDEATTPGVLVVSAIHGLGGIGKSVLAAALAHDSKVQERFSDGVLWAFLSQEPELLSLLSGWVQALGDHDFRPTTVEAASTHLRTLLHDKAVFLVVDDVWDPTHALPFQIGGPRCQVLITTRRADVADEVGADLYQLDVMTKAQSLGLLSACLRRTLVETEREEALYLAEAVGYLPLALKLAAARVARGVSWNTLREALEQEIARLEVLEGPRRRRKGHRRLEATLNLSLNALRAEDEEAWQAFAWLGILPEDVTVATPMVATLWEMDQAEAAEVLELLWNDALLLPGLSVRVGEGTWSAYRLHDLLHDMARRLLTTDPPHGLGFTLPEAHARLLEHYRARTQKRVWHTLPDDGYIHDHLAWHMERAGQAKVIHALLREETIKGQNGWYEARERLGQTAGYLEDVARAWRLVSTKALSQQGGRRVGWGVRYALIVASFNSLVKNIPPALMTALVEDGIWSPSQGLAYARQVPGPKQRAVVLVGLALHLPESFLQEALAVAQEIDDPLWRAEALTSLALHLPEGLRERLLREALAAVRKIGSERRRSEALAAAQGIGDEQACAKALTSLAPHLPEGLLWEALAAARGIRNERVRAEALVGLALHLPEQLRGQALREALAAAREIGNEKQRTEALVGLAPHLPEQLRGQALEEALTAARGIEDEQAHAKAKALSSLAPHLPEELLGEALTVARGIEDEQARAKALSSLVPHLPEGLRKRMLRETLAAARETRWEYYGRAEALVGLAPYLSEGLLGEALAAAREIRWEYDRAKALVGLAPYLPEGLLGGALTAARGIENEKQRTEALVGLASHLPEQLQGQALEEALTVARGIGNEKQRTEALVGLASHLPEQLQGQALEEALMAARGIRNEKQRTEALVGLAPHLPEQLRGQALEEALTVARGIGNEKQRAEALVGLAPHLSEQLRGQALEEALAAAREIEIGDIDDLAWVLVGLAPHLPEQLRGQALEEALVAVWEIKSEGWRAKVLTSLAPHLPEDLLEEAIAVAKETNEWARARALTGLIPHLPEPLREQALEEVLTAAREIKGYEYEWDIRAEALIGLIPHLPEELREQVLKEALAAAREIRWGEERAEVLTILVPHLPEELKEQVMGEVLAATQEIEDDYEWARAEALNGLAPYLPEELKEQMLREALSAAQEIEWEGERAEALVGLAPHLPEELREQVLKEALAAAREIGWGEERAEVLAILAPHLPEELKEQVMGEVLAVAREIEDDYEWARTEALNLAPRLPKGLKEQALGKALAQEIEDMYKRARAKAQRVHAEAPSGLVPHLSELLRDKVMGEVWVAALEYRDEDNRARALVGLVPYLPKGLLGEALTAAKGIGDERVRAEVLRGLSLHLPEMLLEDALAAAREIAWGPARAEALSGLAPYLPEELKEQTLEKALAAARETVWDPARAEALTGLAPRLDFHTRPAQSHLWLEVQDGANLLHFLARRTRRDLLSDFHSLTPVIAELGGEEAIAETFRAIQDVGRWWP